MESEEGSFSEFEDEAEVELMVVSESWKYFED